jgi:hypothetical protein
VEMGINERILRAFPILKELEPLYD